MGERASPAVPATEAASLRRRLLFPLIVLLLLFGATFAGLAMFAGARMNSLALEQAGRLAANAIDDVQAGDRRTALDYAYWDQMVERVFHAYDATWANANIGWLTSEFGIRAAHVLAADNSVLHRQGDAAPPVLDYGAPLDLLLARAREPYVGRPQPVAAFLWRGRELDLVTVCALGTDDDGEELAARPGPALVMARAVDPAFMDRLAKGVGVSTPHIGRVPAALGGASALVGADGRPAAWLHWTPPRPARDALRPLALPVLAALVLLVLVSVAFVLAVRRVTGRSI